MTSDAKIGLLLGLIFIFVIAFIINGLPNLRPQPTKGEAIPGNAMPTHDEILGVADTTQKAQDKLNGWSDLPDTQTEEARGPVTVTTSVEQMTTPKAEQTAVADDAKDGVRSVLPMPSTDGIEKLTKGLEGIVQTLTQASGPAAHQETTEPAPSVDVAKQQPKTEPKVDVKPERTQVADAVDTAKTTKTAKAASTGAVKTYTVVDGDTLGSVAKKVYGVEEGNRIINNQRIFEANRNILKTPNDLAVGQELVIPPPARPKPKPETVLPKSLFEKVEAIGKRQVPAPEKTEPAKQASLKTEIAKQTTAKREPAKPAATAERWYTVQDGDNLWKIASTQLGSGTRYEEIVKLNGDTLKDGIKLDVGTRLRLPSQ
jgi:nucleoid-associated protein YgaU